jgi:hypothetical protein
VYKPPCAKGLGERGLGALGTVLPYVHRAAQYMFMSHEEEESGVGLCSPFSPCAEKLMKT